MSQKQPWNVAGGTYHVMNRGNRKAAIYEDERDRRRFNRLVIKAKQQFRVEVYGSCQLGNHFHQVVNTPHANLPEYMGQFEGEFAKYSNWRHGRVGHLFQGPYQRVLIENDIHLFTALWYLFINPVEAGLVRRPEDWKWSTYAATIGLVPRPPDLSIDWLETLLPASSLKESQELLRRCMASPKPICAYLEIVDPTSPAALRSYIADRQRAAAAPCTYRTLVRPALEDIFRSGDRSQRAAAIQTAHETHGYTLAEIARHHDLTPAAISRIYRAACRRRS